MQELNQLTLFISFIYLLQMLHQIDEHTIQNLK